MPTMRIFAACLLMVVTWSIAIASPAIGKHYSFKVIDVDGRTLGSADGIVTVLVLTTRANLDKARQVGDRIPERCLGNPGYRMITVIEFANTRNRMMQYLLSASIRHGLDSEAKRLKTRYMAKHLTRDARSDVYAVADFNGQTAAQLDLQASSEFRVFVLSTDGTLLHEWANVPNAEELTTALP